MDTLPRPLTALAAPDFAQVLDDLQLPVSQVATSPGEERSAPALLLGAPASSGSKLGRQVAELAAANLAPTGTLLLFLEGRRSQRELAAWRNGLWPLWHVSVIYTLSTAGTTRQTLAGSERLEGQAPKAHRVHSGSLFVARHRVHAMGPDVTREKFDANASGWNGDPGGPGYPHFRWMRRFVACFAPIAPGARLLDFGCGAGWCGIEAAKRYSAASLRFFDPSPEMVRIATSNAAAAGIEDALGRTGFGEAPPLPAADEEPFDAVISSGVVSFAPDPEAWLAGLAPCVARGGQLVIGDIMRESQGFGRRRREKPLLPARELNAASPADLRQGLEGLGFEHQKTAGYQLTRPFPEAMHLSETHLKGLLTYPLLWCNQIGAATGAVLGVPPLTRFDSWVMSFRRRD
ncbi:MAG TPA: class I SAM-dependent methyltransferase [Planctomycetes bacterium]|nr:class I SAM-dependent methyltransferase [Planctomycetota bacterium]HIL51657.1 class I SAM-dependent methyltransferase [Planctomycetota bacterium]